jgi:hypothetical protein
VRGGRGPAAPFRLTGDVINHDSGILDVGLGGLKPVFEHEQFIINGDGVVDTADLLILLGNWEERLVGRRRLRERDRLTRLVVRGGYSRTRGQAPHNAYRSFGVVSRCVPDRTL